MRDQQRIRFEIKDTYWNNYFPYMLRAKTDEPYRRKFGGVDPNNSLLPNSFCLHAIVSFTDGAVLLMIRGAHVAFESSRVSASFEEQLSEFDVNLGAANNTEKWFRRAFCEEIVPLAKTYELEPDVAWNMVDNYIADMRVWALVLEEPIAGYALIGHYTLSIASDQFYDVYKQIKRVSKETLDPEGSVFSEDKRDPEGTFYILPRQEVPKLVRDGMCEALSLAKTPVVLSIDQLHYSSLYRLLLFDNAAEISN